MQIYRLNEKSKKTILTLPPGTDTHSYHMHPLESDPTPPPCGRGKCMAPTSEVYQWGRVMLLLE